MEHMETVKTTNRKLEAYLYAIGIKPISYEVLWDGMVQWTYEKTSALEEACNLFRLMKQRAR